MKNIYTDSIGHSKYFYTHGSYLRKLSSTIMLVFFIMGFANMTQAQSWNQTCKTLPVDSLSSSYYGRSADMDGDYAVISAYAPNSTDSVGRAYVMYNNGSTWETIATLLASDGAVGDYFGYRVSISGDNIVIGADLNDDKGSAYVYTKPTGGWVDMTETAKLTASDGVVTDRFGYSVGISGDNIVVSAFLKNDIGCAYVFTKPSGGWADMTETAILTSSDGASEDYFGYFVSISDDNIVIGADKDDDNGTESGSAYVYTMPTGGWVDMTETAKLKPSDGSESDYFGYSAAISGDNIVIGAHYQDSKKGSAYVFTKPATGWTSMTQTVKLIPSDLSNNDYFGSSVDVSDNIILIGAHGYDENATNTGCVYLYTKQASEDWTGTMSIEKLLASDGYYDDYFGRSVNISGTHILVGAYGDDDYGSFTGSAYAFTSETVVSSIVRTDPSSETVGGINQLVFKTTFSAKVGNVDATDFSINSIATCTITDVTTVNDSVYDITVSGVGLTSFNGTVGLNVNSSSDITDENAASLYTSEPVTDEAYIVDNIDPTVSLSTAATSPVSGDFEVNITFNQEVSGFEASDITVVNGSVNGTLTTSDNITYIAIITPIADGNITVSVSADVAQDLGGNDNEAAPVNIELTGIAPTVTLTAEEGTLVLGDFDITIIFSEEVSGFEASDLTIVNGSVNGALTSADNITYMATITPTADGDVTISVATGVAQDLAGNDNVVAQDLVVVADFTAPTVVISTATSRVSGAFDVTITFSEEVSGFEASDLTIVNGSVNGTTSTDNITYIATITPTVDGDLTIGLAAGTVQDLAGNENEAAEELTLLFYASSGIINNESDLITYYPNPASDNIIIHTNDIKGSIVTIYSLTGQLAMNLTLQQAEETINISELENGIYLLSIKTSTSIVTRKLVVEK